MEPPHRPRRSLLAAGPVPFLTSAHPFVTVPYVGVQTDRKKNTMLTTSHTHWMNVQSGMLLCSDHAGTYLASAIAAHPKRKSHDTPLGTWERLNTAEVEYLASEFGYLCETCHHLA